MHYVSELLRKCGSVYFSFVQSFQVPGKWFISPPTYLPSYLLTSIIIITITTTTILIIIIIMETLMLQRQTSSRSVDEYSNRPLTSANASC